MRSLTIREVRAALARLEPLLTREGEVVVTRHGRPVARLVPIRPAGTMKRMPSHARLRAAMPRLKIGSESPVRADRDER